MFKRLWASVAAVLIICASYYVYSEYKSNQEQKAAMDELEELRKEARRVQYERWKDAGVKKPQDSNQ